MAWHVKFINPPGIQAWVYGMAATFREAECDFGFGLYYETLWVIFGVREFRMLFRTRIRVGIRVMVMVMARGRGMDRANFRIRFRVRGSS